MEHYYYDTENGVIISPGKFEGEPYYVPLFYNMMLEGFADEDEDGVWSFVIDKEDNKRFPELPIGSKLFLEESEQGFVYSMLEV